MRDVTIRHNTFIEIMGPVVTVLPDIDINRFPEARYHGGIVFEDNTIEGFRRTLLLARAANGLVFRNNTIRQTMTYEETTPDAPAFHLMSCDGVEITGNDDRGATPATVKSNGGSVPRVESNQGFAP